MAKIARNDLCPCGSGLKYKRCCMVGANKTIKPIGIYQSPIGFKAEEYSETDILSPLVDQSNEFKNFLNESQHEFKHDIKWLKYNESMYMLGFREKLKSKFTVLFGGNKPEFYIILRKIPPSKEDSIIVAHELGHYLLVKKGYPAVTSTNSTRLSDIENTENNYLASRMNTMIQDAIIDRYLYKFGYDFEPLYILRINSEIDTLQKNDIGNLSIRATLDTIFDYVLICLHVRNNVDNEKLLKTFNDLYTQKLPDIAVNGREILRIIEKYGLDTPGDVFKILSDVIRLLNLQQFQLYPDHL